jgi:hypothetical protein
MLTKCSVLDTFAICNRSKQSFSLRIGPTFRDARFYICPFVLWLQFCFVCFHVTVCSNGRLMLASSTVRSMCDILGWESSCHVLII